jgi:hypothetical protein
MKNEELVALLQAWPPDSEIEMKIDVEIQADNGVTIRQYISSTPSKVYQKRGLSEEDVRRGRKNVIVVKG